MEDPSDGIEEVMFSWMFGDAKILPGLHFLAHANPMRWSLRASMADTVESLKKYSADKERPVKLRIFDSTKKQRKLNRTLLFANPTECVQWLEEVQSLEQLKEKESYKMPQSGFGTGLAMNFLSGKSLLSCFLVLIHLLLKLLDLLCILGCQTTLKRENTASEICSPPMLMRGLLLMNLMKR